MASNMDCSMDWDITQVIASRSDTEEWAVRNLVRLLDQGDTLPFIARYRKELTGDMSVEKLRDIKQNLEELRTVEAKVPQVMKSIDKAGKLTSEITTALKRCCSLTEVETLYAPFKPSPKGTLAERARALGLEPLAKLCLKNPYDVNMTKYVQPGQKGLSNRSEVEAGVKHILADIFYKDKDVIDIVTEIQSDSGIAIVSTKAKGLKKKLKEKKEEKQTGSKANKDDAEKYHLYFDFRQSARLMKPHQVLAINRGEENKILSVHVDFPVRCRDRFILCLRRKFLKNKAVTPVQDLILASMEDCYDRLVEQAMSRHIRSDLKKKADDASIDVFANNLKNLLLTQPARGKCILGIDPGFRNGCKVAVILETGKIQHTDKIFLHYKSVKQDIMNLITNYKCNIVAIGDGVGCRETEQAMSDVIKEYHLPVSYSVVSESGASIYSISDVAKKELPDLDPTLRGAVSIARRLQDPLAELVKVEPKHLGVGQYQHDMPQKQLASTLDSVVEECVSFVGVDLNTASEHLLRRVAGLNVARAKKIIEWRESKGCFVNRQQIKSIKGIGNKSFEQCAGFVRISNGSRSQIKVCRDDVEEQVEESEATVGKKRKKAAAKKDGKSKRARVDIDVPNALDMTAIHPESYSLTERLVERIGVTLENLGSPDFITNVKHFKNRHNLANLAGEYSVGEPTVELVLDALQQPLTYDFREVFGRPIYHGEKRSIEDLRVGNILRGKVTNVTHFGAFVDIGVHRNGLIHQTCMKGFTLQLGNLVSVKIKSLDLDRGRIGLEVIELL